MRWAIAPRLMLTVFIILVIYFPASAQQRLTELVPDNSEVRRLRQELVNAPTDELRVFVPRIENQRSWEHRVRVETRVEEQHSYVLFLNETFQRFPVWSAGSYIVRRSNGSTKPDQVKIFLRSDPGYYVRIFPHGLRARMDVYLADLRTYSAVPIPISFEQVLSSPFSRIMELTDRNLDWAGLFPNGGVREYRLIEEIVQTIRAELPGLPDAEDGAMDEHGEFVFIESLEPQGRDAGFNCSGFAKWVIDGLVSPRIGRYLGIEKLKQKHPEHRGHRWGLQHDDLLDPYFGLDWTRNLARAVMSLERYGTSDTIENIDPRAADVNSIAFSRYTRDVGFPVTELGRIMYLLALREPGYFYLASLNRPFGEELVMRQHTHVAVLFPYFDQNGVFRVAIMERNVETSLLSLIRRYESEFVHLVRVRADAAFEPPHINHDLGERLIE